MAGLIRFGRTNGRGKSGARRCRPAARRRHAAGGTVARRWNGGRRGGFRRFAAESHSRLPRRRGLVGAHAAPLPAGTRSPNDIVLAIELRPDADCQRAVGCPLKPPNQAGILIMHHDVSLKLQIKDDSLDMRPRCSVHEAFNR